jgi:aspartyl-tRNA(Asn)/glutamyl-tRNA(Gln) amidotransferase subunit C
MKREDLRETAALARLTLDEKALEAAFPAFEQMLGFFAVMQSSGAAAFAQAADPVHTGGVARFRPGAPERGAAVASEESASLNETMLKSAGERDGPFIVVPNVL